ncbi:hypothetical protein [Cellulomonas pakistanensis]|uniref:hypothetical protein n=1 Tax=Cellulomonas pakistanensis TaxID=992287 RepID=UPI001941A982|nr:hypothetical protein [Cellulomonas pakistanensis]
MPGTPEHHQTARRAEPLVVRFRPDARREHQRRVAGARRRRGRAALALAALLGALVLVPWVAVTAVEGFEPRGLALLGLLAVPAALAVWGRRLLRRPPVALGAVAFAITPDEIRFEPVPSAGPALGGSPAASWPIAGTTADIEPSRMVGDRLVLRRPGARRRVYLAATLDTDPTTVVSQIAGR